MSHTMGDLPTTSCSSPFSNSFFRLKPHAAFKPTTHTFSRHFKCKPSLARPQLQLSKMLPLNFIAFARGGLVTASGESQVEYEEEKAQNFMQLVDEANEETQSNSNAEKSSVHVMATPNDDKEAFFASLNASKVPIFTTDMLQAGDTHKSSMIRYAHRDAIETPSASSEIIQAQKERMMKKKNQQLTYLFAALASSVGITSLAGASVYCRFAWQMQGGDVPWTEMCGTFSLALGAAVGMEYWARWAHRTLWHASLWSMHESHHQPRDGPFELNDVFAIINAVPAIALMAFGFLNKGLVPGLCFGAGLGITIFGIAYMFVHDGLVHRRFPVGPIADVPYFQKVAAAHQLHHADKFNGVPYGLFLGPMELEEVGGRTELEKLLQKRKREKTNPING